VKRSAPLKRAGFKATTARRPIASGQAPKRRQRPLKPVSAKRAGERDERAEVRRAVFERDGGCLLIGLDPEHRCMGRLTFHHLKKASGGGAYSIDNGATLCVGGNDEVEDRPLWATALGLVRR